MLQVDEESHIEPQSLQMEVPLNTVKLAPAGMSTSTHFSIQIQTSEIQIQIAFIHIQQGELQIQKASI